jgi:hypothetical protein
MPLSNVLGPASKWRATCANVNNAKTARIAFQLIDYEALPESNVSERETSLKKIVESCRELRKSLRTAPENSPILSIQADVEVTLLHALKELRIIAGDSVRTSKDRWKTVRHVLGPSRSNAGPTKTLTADSEAKYITSEDNYWLEAADPLHRSWGHESTEIFDSYLNSGTRLSFWDWLELQDEYSLPKHFVSYLDPKERWRYWVVFKEGRMWKFDERRDLVTFDTGSHSTLFSGQGFAIWVMSPGGAFYTGTHVQSSFHHSSFLGGKRVAAAGEWAVNKVGIPVFINHKTGHYHATPAQLFNALVKLKNEMKVDMSRTVVCLKDFAKNEYKFARGKDFLQSGGDIGAVKSKFGAIFDSDGSQRQFFDENRKNNNWEAIFNRMVLRVVRKWIQKS